MKVNPAYSTFTNVWKKMRDVFKGEEHVKNESLRQNTNNLDGRNQLKPLTKFNQYLRPTDSMRRLGQLGLQRFCDYIFRAKFYPFPLEVHSQSLGLIENEPASFELPTQLEFMLEDSTTTNESLAKVLSIVNSEQLQVSRVGLLLNPSIEPNKPFNIGIYKTEAIVDWHETTIANSETVFDWFKLRTDEVDEDNKPIFLILGLDFTAMTYYQYETVSENTKYGDSFADDPGYIADSFVEPKAAERPLNEIPFVIVNVTRLGSGIERPFLESVADASLSLYRASAHLEDALYWGGESTLFTKGYALGEKDQLFVGNGATNKTSAEYADASYVTMGTDGIGPRKDNRDALFEYCVTLGVNLLNKGTESGKALNIRSNVKTASLKTVSLTGALGLQTLLKIGARWLGLNESDVAIKANTVFADTRYTAEDFIKFSSLVDVGAMRQLDLFQLQKKHNLTTAGNFEAWKEDLLTENIDE